MFVNRADAFGLAQLYQLRGRIGRGKERAFCYLMVPPLESLSSEAKQRLQVLQRFTELGAGFQVASHDLEIRGAGDLLGAQQSGQIGAVGFDMYVKILEEAVAELKGEALTRERDPEHLGLTPQSVHAMGGFKVQGREHAAALELVADAKSLAAAGCFAIVLEGVPDEVARLVTDAVDVPTIGIGAGPSCDGQVLVFHDVLGIEDRFLPKFVRRYADLKGAGVDGLARYAADVRSGAFPAADESYHLRGEVAETLGLYGLAPIGV
jgi:hypothetical protein